MTALAQLLRKQRPPPTASPCRFDWPGAARSMSRTSAVATPPVPDRSGGGHQRRQARPSRRRSRSRCAETEEGHHAVGDRRREAAIPAAGPGTKRESGPSAIMRYPRPNAIGATPQGGAGPGAAETCVTCIYANIGGPNCADGDEPHENDRPETDPGEEAHLSGRRSHDSCGKGLATLINQSTEPDRPAGKHRDRRRGPLARVAGGPTPQPDRWVDLSPAPATGGMELLRLLKLRQPGGGGRWCCRCNDESVYCQSARLRAGAKRLQS